jgi:hypothetical protein
MLRQSQRGTGDLGLLRRPRATQRGGIFRLVEITMRKVLLATAAPSVLSTVAAADEAR